MSRTPEFIDVCAVQTWDAWFRWREHDALKDVSIRDTWSRVARALADPQVEQPVLDAMETWRLLPDERILATAGTPFEAWPADQLAAVLNVAAFVDVPGMPGDSLNLNAMEDTASLAVDMLERAIRKAIHSSQDAALTLRIGVVGFADAMALMGIPYASQRARLLARELSLSLARGSLRKSIELARRLGPRLTIARHSSIASRLRAMAPDLAREAEMHGLRHARLTAIGAHPRLARFANNVADAVDPLACASQSGKPCADAIRAGSQGYAMEWSRRHGAAEHHLIALRQAAVAPMSSQTAIREAMQEWMDEPMGGTMTHLCEN